VFKLSAADAQPGHAAHMQPAMPVRAPAPPHMQARMPARMPAIAQGAANVRRLAASAAAPPKLPPGGRQSGPQPRKASVVALTHARAVKQRP